MVYVMFAAASLVLSMALQIIPAQPDQLHSNASACCCRSGLLNVCLIDAASMAQDLLPRVLPSAWLSAPSPGIVPQMTSSPSPSAPLSTPGYSLSTGSSIGDAPAGPPDIAGTADVVAWTPPSTVAGKLEALHVAPVCGSREWLAKLWQWLCALPANESSTTTGSTAPGRGSLNVTAATFSSPLAAFLGLPILPVLGECVMQLQPLHASISLLPPKEATANNSSNAGTSGARSGSNSSGMKSSSSGVAVSSRTDADTAAAASIGTSISSSGGHGGADVGRSTSMHVTAAGPSGPLTQLLCWLGLPIIDLSIGPALMASIMQQHAHAADGAGIAAAFACMVLLPMLPPSMHLAGMDVKNSIGTGGSSAQGLTGLPGLVARVSNMATAERLVLRNVLLPGGPLAASLMLRGMAGTGGAAAAKSCSSSTDAAATAHAMLRVMAVLPIFEKAVYRSETNVVLDAESAAVLQVSVAGSTADEAAPGQSAGPDEALEPLRSTSNLARAAAQDSSTKSSPELLEPVLCAITPVLRSGVTSSSGSSGSGGLSVKGFSIGPAAFLTPEGVPEGVVGCLPDVFVLAQGGGAEARALQALGAQTVSAADVYR